jgi:hypothetical protein
MAARVSGAWTGFTVFAGTMLMVIGIFNVGEGLIVLLDDDALAVARDKFVVVNVTAWGWTILISGVLMVAAGAGLLAAQAWARITAIVIVALHLVTQVASLGAYPVWSVLMIALDTVVLFALTARWAGVRGRIEELNEEEWVGRDEIGPPPAHAPTIT